jgi:hypothetical protein
MDAIRWDRRISAAYPVQTSLIECNRQMRRCTGAGAYTFHNLLGSEPVGYEVESWTGAVIVFRNDVFCATEVFAIDLNAEAVSVAGHSANRDTKLCKMSPGEEENLKCQLSDGIKIYWEQRQRARPLPLRIIQTLFGNWAAW